MSVLNIVELSVVLNTTLMKTTLNSTLDTLDTMSIRRIVSPVKQIFGIKVGIFFSIQTGRPPKKGLQIPVH